MEEDQNELSQMRETMLSSLGAMVQPARDPADDLAPIEAEMVVQMTILVNWEHESADRKFARALAVEVEESGRRIRNARQLDQITNTLRDPKVWR